MDSDHRLSIMLRFGNFMLVDCHVETLTFHGLAVTPEEAAGPFSDFVDKLTMDMSGKMWAPSEWYGSKPCTD